MNVLSRNVTVVDWYVQLAVDIGSVMYTTILGFLFKTRYCLNFIYF